MSISPHHADLCNRILHPDILLPILSYLPLTYLPPFLRSCRYLHNLTGPLLYRDLPIPSLTPSALCPHLSPIASLFPSSASRSDLRAILAGDTASRKRKLLESARVLRVNQHHHAVLPSVIQDLRLDMGRVERMYIEGGNGICECRGECPIFRGLKPKVVILESTSLDWKHIGGLASTDEIEHLIIKFRPPIAAYPLIDANTTCPLPSLKRFTVFFTPPSYIDRNGREIEEAWVPKSRSISAKGDWSGQPSFGDMVRHIRSCVNRRSVPEVVIVGAEKLDEDWVMADLNDEAVRKGEEGWINELMSRVMEDPSGEEMAGERRVTQETRFSSLLQWKNEPDGAILDSPPISVGFKGKGGGRRPILIHKAITI